MLQDEIGRNDLKRGQSMFCAGHFWLLCKLKSGCCCDNSAANLYDLGRHEERHPLIFPLVYTNCTQGKTLRNGPSVNTKQEIELS